MKQVIFLISLGLAMSNMAFCQKMPAFVQSRLDSIKIKTKKSLIDYRCWDTQINGHRTVPSGLGCFHILPFVYGCVFSYEETLYLDSIGLKLNVGMIYDNEMRNRIVQLLRNKYREDELDTLVNTSINRNLSVYEWRAFEVGKIDTLSVFRNAMDSLYLFLEAENTLNMSKKLNKIYDYEMFKYLQLDTTAIFKQVYENVIKNEREKAIKEITNRAYSYLSTVKNLALTCGYLDDKRFIQPLIAILKGPLNNDKGDVYEKVIEALVRLRAEPYYSDYVKERTLTLEQVQNKYPGFDIQDLAYVLRTQESFLELSKYLLSEVAYSWNIPDLPPGVEGEKTPNPMSDEALNLIRDNIENKDLQQILNVPVSEWWTKKDELKKPTYDWMQKNYGKYKMKRIW